MKTTNTNVMPSANGQMMMPNQPNEMTMPGMGMAPEASYPMMMMPKANANVMAGPYDDMMPDQSNHNMMSNVSPQMSGQMPELDKLVADCALMCNQMGHRILCMDHLDIRKSQLCLLRDCTEICYITSCYMARRSCFTMELANVCAMVCEACGNECRRFNDQMSQMCGQTCLECARICRSLR